MKFFERLKNQINRRRLSKALKVNLRWGWRRVRRFFEREAFIQGVTGSYARRLYAMLAVLGCVCILAAVAQYYSGAWYPDERELTARLENPAYDPKDPVELTLHQFGSSNRIQVALRTAKETNKAPQGVDLDAGALHLVMTLKDGKMMEYPLQNKRIDNFESGNIDYFTLILPDSVAPFDIVDYRLALLPDAKGNYDDWHCLDAKIACLLGGERVLLAQSDWEGTMVLGAQSDAAALPIVTDTDSYYQQINSIYPYALSVCKAKGGVHTRAIKNAANIELGLMSGDTLYIDIETVSLEIQNALLAEQEKGMDLIENDPLDYDGKMTLRVRFITAFEGSYYKDYDLDTPGKDDFELGTSSTFALAMPEGASVFDIRGMELLVEDAADSWAPRLIRAYLRTDYGTALEIARITDIALKAERKTGIFYQGLIETSIAPLRLDTAQQFALPKAIKNKIEKQYYTEIKGVIYSMYFGEHNFNERRMLYYSQIHALYGEE